jgi:hypothetical protein
LGYFGDGAAAAHSQPGRAMDTATATAVYYEYSTIAQALAAAMALLAAFAMFRLKSIDEECKGAASAVEGATGGGDQLRQHYLVSDWVTFRQEVNQRFENLRFRAPQAVTLLRRIDQLLVVAGRIRRTMWVSLGLTAISIAGSIAVLAVVPRIAEHCAVITLAAGVLATILCLGSYVRLIIDCFRGIQFTTTT